MRAKACTVKIDPAVWAQCKAIADASGMKLCAFVERALRAATHPSTELADIGKRIIADGRHNDHCTADPKVRNRCD